MVDLVKVTVLFSERTRLWLQSLCSNQRLSASPSKSDEFQERAVSRERWGKHN